MKKQLLLGVVLTAVVAGQQSFAAPIRSMEAVRTELTEKVKKSSKAGELDVLKNVEVAEQKNKMTEALSGIQGSQSSTSLGNAVRRGEIKVEGLVAGVKAEIKVDTTSVAKDILAADQALKNINRNDLDAAGKAHYETMEKAVKVSVEFLKLAARTSDMRADIDAATKQDAAVFAQQLSLVGEIFKMETADAQAHIEIMEKAIARRGPQVNGDQALAAVLKEGKTDEAYRAKQEEILGCIR